MPLKIKEYSVIVMTIKKSKFVQYFAENFASLGLKSLRAIAFKEGKHTELIEITCQIDDYPQAVLSKDYRIKITPMSYDGDFRHEQSITLLKNADIVCTNPPFSLFRDFIDLLIEQKKEFLIIGNSNAVSYKNCFAYIAANQIQLGHNCVRWFYNPNGILLEGARSYWYTNLSCKEKSFFPLTETYFKDNYPEYDNYQAIEVSKVKNIPQSYDGIMGVPLTFLEKYNAAQFEILGMD